LGVSTRDGQWTQFGFHFEGTVSCLDVDGTYAIIGIDTTFSGSSANFQGSFLTSDHGSSVPGVDSFAATPTAFTFVGDTLPSDCDVRVPFGQFAPEQVTNET
jgi:hypothetical protein